MIISLGVLSYLSMQEISNVNTQFLDVLREEGILYASMYSQNSNGWLNDYEKLENGMFAIKETGSVKKMTYLSMVKDKDELDNYFKGFKKVASRRILFEINTGDVETLYYIGRGNNKKSLV